MRAVLAVVALLASAGCGAGEQERAADAERELEAQRTAVRDAAAGLGRAVLARVDGWVVDSGGTYRGCGSAFMDEYATFRYVATVRITGGAGRDLGGLAREHVEDGVEVSLRPVAGEGRSGDWLVSAAGSECVDVPEGQRDRWLGREDPVTDELL